jgi:hypothetical protein
MRNTTRLLSSIALLAACPCLPAADVAVFTGAPGGVGDVLILDEAGVLPPISPVELRGILLLPVDVTGRTVLSELDPAEPRLRADVPGTTRVRLPAGAGSLYRYRRDHAAGADFGFLLVDDTGSARTVFELAGTGPLGTDDPTPDRAALSPDGGTLLVASTVAAGGNLYEVDLATGAATDRTADRGPLAFTPDGQRLLGEWGVALTSIGAVRFERQPNATATDVPFVGEQSPSMAFQGSGVATSTDETTVAFVAGSAPDQAHVLSFGRLGAGRRVTPTAGSISGAGLLPDCLCGPTLALSPDGATVAWRTEDETNEAWVRPRVAPLATPAFQITSDERFSDTLSETGMISFGTNFSLLLIVGQLTPPGGPGGGAVESGELFRLDTSTNTISNVSQTSGETQAPFLAKGQLATEDGLWCVPGSSSVLAVRDPGTGVDELLQVDWSTGATATILDEVKSIEIMEQVGTETVFAVRRSLIGNPRDLFRLPAGSTAPVPMASFPESCDLTRASVGGGADFAAVLDCGGLQWLGRAAAPSWSGSLVANQPFVYGPTFGVTSTGDVYATVTVGGRNVAFHWAADGATRGLGILPAGGHVLPAN